MSSIQSNHNKATIVDGSNNYFSKDNGNQSPRRGGGVVYVVPSSVFSTTTEENYVSRTASFEIPNSTTACTAGTTSTGTTGCISKDNKEVLADATNDDKLRSSNWCLTAASNKVIRPNQTNTYTIHNESTKLIMTGGVRSTSTTGSLSTSGGTTSHPPLPSSSSRANNMNHKNSPQERSSTTTSFIAPVSSSKRSYEDVAVFSMPPYSPELLSSSSTSTGMMKQRATPSNTTTTSKSIGGKTTKEAWQISPAAVNKSNSNGTPTSTAMASSSSSNKFYHLSSDNLQQSRQNNNERIIVRSDPEQQDQALFESRLMEDPFGVAIRKINHSGKPQLRYVKCIPLSSNPRLLSSSVASSTASSVRSSRRVVRKEKKQQLHEDNTNNEDHYNLLSTALTKRRRALTWGQKTKVVVAFEKFTCVRKGKTTERTRKCPSPSCQLLSVLTDDRDIVLDMEAPTKTDRDKFAQAFAQFLGVPLEAEIDASVTLDGTSTPMMQGSYKKSMIGSAQSAPGEVYSSFPPPTNNNWKSTTKDLNLWKDERENHGAASLDKEAPLALLSAMAGNKESVTALQEETVSSSVAEPQKTASVISSSINDAAESSTNMTSINKNDNKEKDDDDEHSSLHSTVSSITAGLEPEIVDELHQVIQDLRAELEASRAEAARAVKVAEQAIQSAENCSSKDWNSTVTHKAAEAAAQAQKRSAEAMARQRLAEEKLASEKRSTAFWKRQAEAAEEEAGTLQTRAAAAEIQRSRAQHMLQLEREMVAEQLVLVKSNLVSSGARQKMELEALRERNRALEIAIERTRLELGMNREENKSLIEQLTQMKLASQENSNTSKMKLKLGKIGGKKKSKLSEQDAESSMTMEPGNLCLLSDNTSNRAQWRKGDLLTTQLRRETMELRNQFDLFRITAADELKSLPNEASLWVSQVTQALLAAQSETKRVMERLVKESALRRRLAHKVQDQRGTVRVYCRPRPTLTSANSIVSVPSDSTVVIRKEKNVESKSFSVEGSSLEESDISSSLGFEFDRVFSPTCSQTEIYEEVETLVMDALDGYSVCIMAYGQTNSGKTFTLLGNIEEPLNKNSTVGIHLNAVRHMFDVAEKRSERYQDTFSITILEIQEDRLFDLVAGTQAALKFGQHLSADAPFFKKKSKVKRNSLEDISSSSTGILQQQKLEIKTNFDGDTIVHGLTTVPISHPEDIVELWNECLSMREVRLVDQGKSLASQLSKSHLFYTVSIVSKNVSTGVISTGKLQFVDFAGSDFVPMSNNINDVKSALGKDWVYKDKSLTTLSEVVEAKCQFLRTVPYRNSTLTHLLRDSFEGDAKVLMFCCISSDVEDAQQTKEALRFATRMKRVSVGIATKRTAPSTISES